MRIASIRLDGDTQSRVNLNQELVTEYTEAMREGAKFPPVTVFYDGTDNWLSDGFHRLYAARNAEFDEIDADVRQGTLRDAKLFSMSANAVHGLRRTNADKRRAVMMALEDEEWRELSNREIAEMCAVSHAFVNKVRAEGGNRFHSAELPTNQTKPHETNATIQMLQNQINEMNERFANQTPPDTSIAVQQAVRQESDMPYTARRASQATRERAELAMYEYKKKARELEAQLQAVRSTPAPQPVVEVREVVPDDVKARLEEQEAELKKLQETLEVHKKAGKDLAGIEEKINERYKAYRKLLEKCDKDEEKAKMGIELSTSVMNLTDFLTKHKGYYEHLVRYGAPTHISAGRIKQAAGLCAEISELLYTAAKTISSKEGEFIDV